MPHTYQCQLRWADMDLLGHVNNVTYLDYVTEAREALFAGHPAGRAPVSRHLVDFVAPLVFRRRPVLVDTWVTEVRDDEVVLAQEVYDAPTDEADEAGTRTTYLRCEPVRAEFALVVRRSDLDEQGRARPGVLFEYVQEARIRYLMQLHTRGEHWSQHVVARTDVDYLAPVTHRSEPYLVQSWVAHLGSRSFTIRSDVRDGDRVLARAAVVMVTFDLETQGAAEMAPQQRARLERELR